MNSEVKAEIFFLTALEHLERSSNTYEKALTLADAATLHIHSRVRSRGLLLQAITAAEGILEEAERNKTISMLTPAEQMMAYEEIAKTAINCGHGDLLETVFACFDTHDSICEFDSTPEKIELLGYRVQKSTHA